MGNLRLATSRFAGGRGLRGWRLLVLLGLLIGWLGAVPLAIAQSWRGQLEGGPEIMVDPDTRRATGVIDGERRPLWDGVHKLEDGSTVIVRDGIAVPTEPMYQQWRGQAEPEPVFARRYCKQLVRKTCGFDDACRSSAACLRARALLDEAAQDRRGRSDFDRDSAPSATNDRCRDALDDPEFPACSSIGSEAGDSRCRALVERTCGADNACADSQACDAARQLQGLETQERLTNADPSALSQTGRQCLEAMNNSFFEPCEQR
jgi:hypothetical protein